MKRILNRVVSMLLVFSFCLTMGLSTTAYATDEGLESPSSVITFIDSEGKTNAVEIFCLQDGSVITKLYIEGILFGTTTTQYNEESDYIHITRIGNDGATIEKNVPRSTYVVADGIPSLSTEATVNASYNKEGTIYYNPYYGENLSIEVFTTNLGSSSHYKTFAVDAGTYVDILIGTVVNYLISIRNELSALGQEVWGMMLAASGVAVVSGMPNVNTKTRISLKNFL